MTLQLIAMHGWAGDQRGWQPFAVAAAGHGWSWSPGERGYGGLPPAMPAWQPEGRRVLVVHSLGLHLLPTSLLAQAEAVVLLASFGRFVPEGPAGRRLRVALTGMEQSLQQGEARAMLQSFMVQAAAPQARNPDAPWIGDHPIQAEARRLLLEDLRLLSGTTGLPAGFPPEARVLIVEGGCDRIVVPEARRELRDALPDADRLQLSAAGHLLQTPALAPMLFGWLGALP
ncbi:MAG: alpha/beta hydrolase [Cyanobacteriota bacterium]|nr:alpha/beta hydrolase [Cyanobacteriota bacterium]